MADKPILFSAPMVRALLGGTKTQTRRVIKPQPVMFNGADAKLRISVGDRLYVREQFAMMPATSFGSPKTISAADPYMAAYYREGFYHSGKHPWRPSIHMPRWASRLTLTITDVRVQRLQDISEEDARAEGITPYTNSQSGEFGVQMGADTWCVGSTARNAYEVLWSVIHDKPNTLLGQSSWDANPWVAAYTFTVALRNIDQIARTA